ncbi:hypothetical protein KJ966_19840 [bacterium]|nr:hypothetical protein [bacterium]
MIHINGNKEITLEETILEQYPPDILDDIFRRYFRDLLDLAPQLESNWNLKKKEYQGLSIRSKEIARLISIVFSDKEIFEIWLDKLPYIVAKVLETLAWEGQQEIRHLNSRAKGRILPEASSKKPDYSLLKPEFCLFILTKQTNSQASGDDFYYFSLPQVVRKKLKSHLPKPKGYYLKPLKSLQSTDYEFADQNRIQSNLPVIFDYFKRGGLKITKSGAPRISSLLEIMRLTEMEEFFPGQSDSEFKTLRISLILQLCLLMRNWMEDQGEMIARKFRELFAEFAMLEENTLLSFLTNIKGWYQTSDLLNKNIHQTLFDLLKELPVEKWISIKQLMRFAQLRDLNLQPINPFAVQSLYIPGEWQGWGHSKQYIKPDQIFTMITEPMLKAGFFLFAAFGLVDIHYNNPKPTSENSDDPKPYSVFDGLIYVRLTKLGAFTCRISDEFPVEANEPKSSEVLLDDSHLIITVHPGDNLMEMKLERYSRKIGRSRFLVDFDSFLCNVNTKEEIENQIEELGHLVMTSFPKNWERFFDRIRSKYEVLSCEEDFLVLKIRQSDTELLELITSDEELRQMILLVEDRHFAIKKQFMSKLKQRLRIFGYLF